MAIDAFSQRKRDVLGKDDKSRKGSWDAPIADLCEQLNDLHDYYTTSSCSGRILLVKDLVREKRGAMLVSWHESITFDVLQNALDELQGSGVILFKQEPCLLHVACRDEASAQQLLQLGQRAGWKQSGIISLGNKWVVELRSSEHLSVPVIDSGKELVDEPYLHKLVEMANTRLLSTWKKIHSLHEAVKRLT